MFACFGKPKARIAPEPEKPYSAPARLEGLDGTEPPAPAARRALTPDAAMLAGPRTTAEKLEARAMPSAAPSTSAEAQQASPASPKPVTKGPKKVDAIGAQSDGHRLAADLPAASAVPDHAQPWVQVFGEATVRNIHAGDWRDREAALGAVSRCVRAGGMPKASSSDPLAIYQAATELLSRSLKDKVAPLYHASLELLAAVVDTYGGSTPAAASDSAPSTSGRSAPAPASFRLPKQQLHQHMDIVVPAVLHRCGNLNTRIHESSLQALLHVAQQPFFGVAYLAPHTLSPLAKKGKESSVAAQLFGRMELLSGLLSLVATTSGHNEDALSVELVLPFTRQGLESPDDKVRQCTIRAIVELYKLRRLAGEELQPERYLGPVKPALLQVLQRRFAEAGSEVDPAVVVASGKKAPLSGPASAKQLPPLSGSSKLGPLRASATVDMHVAGSQLSISTPPDAPASTSAPSPKARSQMLRSAGTPPGSSRPGTGRPGNLVASPSHKHTAAESAEALAALAVPKYSAIARSCAASAASTPARGPRSPAPGSGIDTILDEHEEALINYMMADDAPNRAQPKMAAAH